MPGTSAMEESNSASPSVVVVEGDKDNSNNMLQHCKRGKDCIPPRKRLQLLALMKLPRKKVNPHYPIGPVAEASPGRKRPASNIQLNISATAEFLESRPKIPRTRYTLSGANSTG